MNETCIDPFCGIHNRVNYEVFGDLEGGIVTYLDDFIVYTVMTPAGKLIFNAMMGTRLPDYTTYVFKAQAPQTIEDVISDEPFSEKIILIPNFIEDQIDAAGENTPEYDYIRKLHSETVSMVTSV
jgi:hypothetical protein